MKKEKQNGIRNNSNNGRDTRTESSGTSGSIVASGTVRSDDGKNEDSGSSVTTSENGTGNSNQQNATERSENRSVGIANSASDRESRKFTRADGTIGYRRPGRSGSNDNRSPRTSASTGTGTGTGKENEQSNALATDVEPPPFTKKQRNTKKKQAETEFQKLAITAMVGTCLNTLFHGLSFKLGNHWKLTDEENAQLSIDLDNALSTLPGESYAVVIEYLAKCAPWFALAITANAIVSPRITASKAIRVTKPSAPKSNATSESAQTNVPNYGNTNSLPFDLSASH